MFGVMRMISMAFIFLVSLHLLTCSSYSSHIINNNNKSSISSIRCHSEERDALLGFLNSFTIDNTSFNDHGLQTWKKGSDCCGWDGIKCHPTSHHVVELVLEESGLAGTLDSNNTLFHLHHLRILDLSENDFSHSNISPMFGSSFPHLEELVLSESNFSGEVPAEISQLSNLQYLDLSSSDSDDIVAMKISTLNKIISNMTSLKKLGLGGVNIDSTFPPSITNLSSLRALYLRSCKLRGELPSNILNLPQLKYINLGENQDLHANFPLSNWSASLVFIDLTNVNYSSELPQSLPFQSQSTQLQVLLLRGCSLHGQIPGWVWNMTINYYPGLEVLDLSDNKFNGSINLNDDIHSKLQNLNVITSLLEYLNISHNYLTGSLTSLPWNYLEILDLSNNNFTGPLPSPLCNLTYLQLLDLSNNNFKDEAPQCLGNLSSNLKVLNLGSNNISGTFPDATFSDCSNLEQLDLSNNWFQGLVPRLLTRCKILEVINLRSNQFQDEFPHWIGTLSHIRVLDLSNNGFFGPLPPSNASNPFSTLQVLDLSNNNLSGDIPIGFLERFKAMMKDTQSVRGLEYMEINDWGYYLSIMLTFNGLESKYKKVIKTLATFDLSNNKFEGEIPHNIGKLVALHCLNLSHNQFIGHIPPSLGNLISINCLDLSSNKLTGQIPQELASLAAMGVFNVSYNKLEGPLPNDNHFETFPVDSYKGNLGLCGFPLPECGKNDGPSQQPSKKDDEDEDVGTMSEWMVVMIGCGFGTFVSFAWGCYMLAIGRPLWLLKLVLILVDNVEKMIGRRRRRPRRGRN